ncbi:hypothetical protein HUU40_02365 [candidate division KSB1 bacterium]|nr:hypothetical protein [candidate division KSB1 bacterium]
MGQQQLLLLVAGTIIVALAVVGGLNLFGNSTDQANKDAVVQDLMSVASVSQSWCMKPALMGGGGGAFTGFTLNKVDWPAANDNGTFAVNGTPTTTELKVDGKTKSGKTITVTLTVDANGKINTSLTGV